LDNKVLDIIDEQCNNKKIGPLYLQHVAEINYTNNTVMLKSFLFFVLYK